MNSFLRLEFDRKVLESHLLASWFSSLSSETVSLLLSQNWLEYASRFPSPGHAGNFIYCTNWPFGPLSVLIKLCKVFQIRRPWNLWVKLRWKWVNADFLRGACFEPSSNASKFKRCIISCLTRAYTKVLPIFGLKVSIFLEKCQLVQFLGIFYGYFSSDVHLIVFGQEEEYIICKFADKNGKSTKTLVDGGHHFKKSAGCRIFGNVTSNIFDKRVVRDVLCVSWLVFCLLVLCCFFLFLCTVHILVGLVLVLFYLISLPGAHVAENLILKGGRLGDSTTDNLLATNPTKGKLPNVSVLSKPSRSLVWG